MLVQLGRVSETSLGRARSEYWEMPGLTLTPEQARRVWGLDQESCDTLLGELLIEGFLARTRTGAFVLRGRSLVR